MRPLLALALRAFPRAFRERFGAGMLEVMLADYDRARARGRARALVFVVATVVDALVDGVCGRGEAAWIDPGARARARTRAVKAMLEAWTLDFVFAARSLARAPSASRWATRSLSRTCARTARRPALPAGWPRVRRIHHDARPAHGLVHDPARLRL